jgi:hypothetical protein
VQPETNATTPTFRTYTLDGWPSRVRGGDREREIIC